MQKDGSNLPEAMKKILEQFDINDLQTYIANLDGEQKEQLLATTINMLEQQMTPEDKETMNLLFQTFMGKK